MIKPLIKFYPWPKNRAQHYITQGYWINEPLTHILSQRCASDPKATALICGDRQLSYQALDDLSTHLAHRISAQGIGKGDTALVQLPNTAEFYIVFFALLKIGVVPLNALYSHRQHELRSFCQQIKPQLLIVSATHEVFKDDDFINELHATDLSPQLVLTLNDAANTASKYRLETWIAASDMVDADDAHPVLYSPTPADEVAFFQLSGGSTGTPKLIPRTHNDYYYSVRASADICRLDTDTRLLCALPAPHNFMMSSPGALGVLYAGGTVVMAPDPEPLKCFSIIARYGVTMASLVPSAVVAWIEQAPKHAAQLKTLQLIQVGGANFSETLARKVPIVFGCALQQVFGMAEGLVNYTRLDDADEQIFTSQGRPISPDDEVMIVDEQGNPVPEGEVGMLTTRGPYTFCGYYQSPEHNANAFDKNGYYASGDLVQRTPEGNLRVVGRVKDQINRGGEKIASEEIENLILAHPDVLNAALIAITDPRLGEKSCLYIISRDPNIKASTLRRYLLNTGIAQYKIPDRFKFIESMPLTAVGKTDKKALRTLQLL
ncbi:MULTISPECIES: (2,3-dihydroxybenzoyl)adenylate synthase [Psychrobacter]|uniref:(2,3-dihydroxybenzoyl)adenylate synthase n=1 Tax=Psychrobacter TaxID=497 RepID=UPI000EEFEF66|nr:MULTISPECIES: (2,3-dihydroxybenzoyl)adenylate synthase [Psychrobacter]MBE0441320.1 (2,3-dihydroxybenzoyl)adenylate synthase [Psychrobacter sp. FME13]HCR88145.1 2,3-dihydroxybenzoate-AMP ligase [Psychrobacter sp.]